MMKVSKTGLNFILKTKSLLFQRAGVDIDEESANDVINLLVSGVVVVGCDADYVAGPKSKELCVDPERMKIVSTISVQDGSSSVLLGIDVITSKTRLASVVVRWDTSSMYTCSMHTCSMYAWSMHTCLVHTCLMHTCLVHTCSMKTFSVHACLVHACLVHTCLMHTCSVHTC